MIKTGAGTFVISIIGLVVDAASVTYVGHTATSYNKSLSKGRGTLIMS